MQISSTTLLTFVISIQIELPQNYTNNFEWDQKSNWIHSNAIFAFNSASIRWFFIPVFTYVADSSVSLVLLCKIDSGYAHLNSFYFVLIVGQFVKSIQVCFFSRFLWLVRFSSMLSTLSQQSQAVFVHVFFIDVYSNIYDFIYNFVSLFFIVISTRTTTKRTLRFPFLCRCVSASGFILFS